MLVSFFFFFNDTATTEIYTLSLHDALPISLAWNNYQHLEAYFGVPSAGLVLHTINPRLSADDLAYIIDRKSTRRNSSHANISYAVFCLKKKKKKHNNVELI